MLSRRSFIGSTGATLLLPGCATMSAVRSRRAVSLESLVRQLKHDIGTYVYNHQGDPIRKASENPCAGDVNFTIQKVKMTVTATFDGTTGLTGGLKVPVGLVTLNGSLSSARKLSNTVTTSLTLWPLAAGKDAVFDGDNEKYKYQHLTAPPPPSPDFEGTPINDALEGLRNDLIKTADTAPCFNFGEEGKPQDNVVKWGFTIEDKISGGGGFSILIFSVGAEGSTTNTLANTLEVSFIATGDGSG